MSQIKVVDALKRLTEISRHLPTKESREMDSLLDIIHQEHKAVYVRANTCLDENGNVVTESGEILRMSMDKSMALLLGYYGMSLGDIKADMMELQEDGMSPVKRIILPRPKLLGCELEFDDIDFPELE